MTWNQRGNELTLTCNGPSCGTTMKAPIEHGFLDATRALWRKAEAKGWTASSTDHLCARCSE